MHIKIPVAFALTLLGILVAAIIYGSGLFPQKSETLALNPYTDFTVYRSDGEAVTLSEHIGTPIAVNFWASWCGPCRVEMPHFEKIENEFPEVLFFMINLTDGRVETIETVEKFLTDNELSFENMLFDLHADAAHAYSISSIPVTLFIDPTGNIVDQKMVALTEEQLRTSVESLLN